MCAVDRSARVALPAVAMVAERPPKLRVEDGMNAAPSVDAEVRRGDARTYSRRFC